MLSTMVFGNALLAVSGYALLVAVTTENYRVHQGDLIYPVEESRSETRANFAMKSCLYWKGYRTRVVEGVYSAATRNRCPLVRLL